jgi:hypothetical protein
MRWILSAMALVACSAQASAQKNLCAKASQPVDPKVPLTNIGRTGSKIADLHRLCRAENKVELGFGAGQMVQGYITYLTPQFFEVQFVPDTEEPRNAAVTVIHIPLTSLRSAAPQLRGSVHLEIRKEP